nr:agenet-like domain, agenet domain [Tanacetum cinerariifolium]
MANNLMDKKVHAYAARNAKNKRKLENNSKDNQVQQPPFERENVAQAYTVRNNENNKKKGYVGSLPYCNKYKLYHKGQCTVRCSNGKKLEFARRLGLYQAVELEDEGFNVYFKGGLRNDDNFNAHDYWLSINREDNLGKYSLGDYEMDEEERSCDSERESNLLWSVFSKLARKCRVLTDDVVRSLSALIYYRDLDTTTLRDLIDFDGKLITEDPQPGVPRVGIPRPPRASMQDLYDMIGRMEIRQDTIERMKYRQSYHWDRIMDPNSSLGKICLGDDVVVISSDKVEGLGDWNSLEYQDTAGSKGKKVINALSFYKMERDEISERYITLCFVNGLEAYDGKKLVKKELIVALRGELYFVKFIINPMEDDSELGVILERSFMRLAKGVVDFEERHVIETMTYNDKYKKILDEIWKDKVKLDRKTIKEEEDAVKRIKGEALKEKDNPGAFIFPIRLEGKVNKNALADTGGISMINHTQAEDTGKLSNVLCQVGVTTIIAKFLILDIPIDCDAPIMVGRGFLYTMGSILNTPKRLFSTFDEVCHQTFRAARFDVLTTSKSDSDDAEEYVIKRNKFEAPIYSSKLAPYLNCTNLEDRSSAIQISKKIIKFRLGGRAYNLTLLEFARRLGLYQVVELEDEGFNVYFEGGLRNDDNFNAHDYWLSISQEDNLEDNWENIAWVITKWMKRKGVATQKESQIYCGQFLSKLARKCRVLTDDMVRILSASIYCRDLDTTTLRDLIDSDGKLITEDTQPSVPRVGIPIPPRSSMQDLYDMIGRIKIRHNVIERMKYR